MTLTRIAKNGGFARKVTFRRAAREEEDDGQEEGCTRGGRHSENGGGVDKVTQLGSGRQCRPQ
jgi:hypothetical protein